MSPGESGQPKERRSNYRSIMKGLVYPVILFFISGMLAVSAGEKIKLTLTEAQALALEQNPTLAVAEANIRAAAAAVESAVSAYYPTLGFSAGLTRVRDSATRPQRDFDNDSRYEAGIAASWLLYDGGARHLAKLIAERGGDIAVASCDDARRTLLENVAYAFFTVVQSRNSMKIALQDAEFNRVLHKDAQTRLENGVAKPSEVLNFEFQVGEAEVSYITAERTWYNSCIVLGQLLALEREQIWEILELVEPDPDELDGKMGDLAGMLAYAREHRPDYLSAQYSIVRAQMELQKADTEYVPTVSAFYNYGFERMGSGHFNTHYDRDLNFGLKLDWTLFSGFSTEAKRAAAQAQLDAARNSLEQVDLAISAEIRRNDVALSASRRTLEKQNKQYEIAKKIRDLVKEEYDGGTATITRLNEVQTDLTNAALARNNAYIQVLNNIEALKSSTGYTLTAVRNGK